MSRDEKEELRKYLDKNLARSFISPTTSPHAAPVMFVQKKDGGLRLCADYRDLNAVSMTNAYPIPLIKDLLQEVSTGKIFTKLDLWEAYHRVRIRKGDKSKMAFCCNFGQFCYNVMPFGLSGAPGIFINLINDALKDFLHKGAVAYIDDVLLYSDSLEEHVALVRDVLTKFAEHSLFVKLSKCEFHHEELTFLGYRVSTKA